MNFSKSSTFWGTLSVEGVMRSVQSICSTSSWVCGCVFEGTFVKKTEKKFFQNFIIFFVKVFWRKFSNYAYWSSIKKWVRKMQKKHPNWASVWHCTWAVDFWTVAWSDLTYSRRKTRSVWLPTLHVVNVFITLTLIPECTRVRPLWDQTHSMQGQTFRQNFFSYFFQNAQKLNYQSNFFIS